MKSFKRLFSVGVPIALLMLAIIILANCRKATTNSTNLSDQTTDPIPSSLEINLSALVEQAKMPPVVSVDIEFDHVFKRPKRYQSYSLKQLLAPYIVDLGIDDISTSDAVVTFYCMDGYTPTQKLRELFAEEGYIAFRDELVQDPDKNWPDSVQAKLSPYYLVWKNVPYDDHSLAWPYDIY